MLLLGFVGVCATEDIWQVRSAADASGCPLSPDLPLEICLWWTVSKVALAHCSFFFLQPLNPSLDVARYIWKGGIGGGGWVHSNGANSMAISGLHFGNALVGSEWATAILLCTNGLREQSSRPAQCPFPLGKLLSQSGQAAASWVLWLLPAR